MNSIYNDAEVGSNTILRTHSLDSRDMHRFEPSALAASSASATESHRPESSLAAQQLAAGILQIYEPPLSKVRVQLKELIGKQNKIYVDLSAEKYKLDNSEMAKLCEMMATVKVYREKLIKIKKQMQTIYQRTKVLKKRATYIQTCKQKELQRRLLKQQQEEALIGKQQK